MNELFYYRKVFKRIYTSFETYFVDNILNVQFFISQSLLKLYEFRCKKVSTK